MVTMTTIGYGDFVAARMSERLDQGQVIIWILGYGAFANLISSASECTARFTCRRARCDKIRHSILRWARRKNKTSPMDIEYSMARIPQAICLEDERIYSSMYTERIYSSVYTEWGHTRPELSGFKMW